MFESIEGKALQSFLLRRAVGVLFGGCLWGWDTPVPSVQPSMERASFYLSAPCLKLRQRFLAGCHEDLLITSDHPGMGS